MIAARTTPTFTAQRPAAPMRRAAIACRASAAQRDGLALRVAQFAATTMLATGLTAGAALADGVSFKGGLPAVASSPLHVEMAVEGMLVRPAADGIIPGTGHFHVLIDAPAPAEGEAIPFEAGKKHYGKGQTADDIELAPGKHTLVLQFANALHESYGPAYAKSVTVTIK